MDRITQSPVEVMNEMRSEVDRHRVVLSMEETKRRLKDQFGIDERKVDELRYKIESQLPGNWFDNYRKGEDIRMWEKSYEQLLERKGRLMQVRTNNEKERMDILQSVTWLMVGKRVLEEGGDVEVTVVDKPDESERFHGDSSNFKQPIVEGVVVEKGRNENLRNGLADGEAVVQYEGIVVRQVSVDSRATCVLAVMQMLLSHAGYIRLDSRANLVEAKGDMLKVAEEIGALTSPELGGSIRLNDLEWSVRPVLEAAKRSLIDMGVAHERSSLGKVTVAKLAELSSGLEGEDRRMYVLDLMREDFVNGENVIFGYTMTDTSEYSGSGHERIINGVGCKDGRTYFHILDPISGASWVEKKVVAKDLGGPIFKAESFNAAKERQVFEAPEPKSAGGSISSKQRIVW